MTNRIVEANKVVYITYSIRSEDGEVLEQYDLPVGYVHGADSGLIEPIEQALEGEAPGARVEVTVPPEHGFGPHLPDLVFHDDIGNVPPQYRRVGAEAMFENEQGEAKTFRVTRVDDARVTLDGNHPLAGKTLTYSVTVVGVRDATPEEIARGRPADPADGSLH